MSEPAESAEQKRVGIAKSAATLTLIAVVATLAISLVAERNTDRIAANILAWETRTIAEVLPTEGWNNEPWQDAVAVSAPEYLGSAAAMPVYRARQNGVVVAVAVSAVATDAYVGPVRMLIGLRSDQSIVAVRATEHRETPGLGDQIDANKSNWIDIFTNLPADLNAAAWEVGKQAGQIAPITGATVTSRAVANAVRSAQAFYVANQTLLDGAVAGSTLDPAGLVREHKTGD